MSKHSKVAIIGAGNVGAAVAYTITLKDVAAEVHLIDINEKKEKGEVMDIADGLCYVETGCIVASDYKQAQDADIVIITAGAAQKEGDTRLDLLEKNKTITKSIIEAIGTFKKDAILLMITNPVDVLTYMAQKWSKLPKGQVFGTGTALDTARLKTNLSKEFGISAHDVHGYVMGEHGDSAFIAWSSVHLGGTPLKLSSAKKKKIETHVREEAYEIIKRKGATYFGIASSTAEIVEAILHDQKRILPVSTLVKRYNGVSDVCIGVPAVIGSKGVESIWPMKLTLAEKKKLAASAKILTSYIKKIS